jgi:hypothetical protein
LRLVTALSVRVSVPFTVPVAVGGNVTPILQFAIPAMLDPQVFEEIANVDVVQHHRLGHAGVGFDHGPKANAV